MKRYYCYILECADGTLYTGYTSDLQNRFQVHNEGKGAKYTRGRTPCKLVYYEEFAEKGEAMKREYAIKKHMTRKDKIKLIQTKEDENRKRGKL